MITKNLQKCDYCKLAEIRNTNPTDIIIAGGGSFTGATGSNKPSCAELGKFWYRNESRSDIVSLSVSGHF